MDVQDSTVPGLTRKLCASGNGKLRQIVDVAGPGFHNTEAVASLLGLRSFWHTRDILNLWLNKLTKGELDMLQEYSLGLEIPVQGEPFPELGFAIHLNGFTGPLLKLYMTNGKTISCQALAVNASVTKMNIFTVYARSDIPETVFHCFSYCKRLESLFEMLFSLFRKCDCKWSITASCLVLGTA